MAKKCKTMQPLIIPCEWFEFCEKLEHIDLIARNELYCRLKAA